MDQGNANLQAIRTTFMEVIGREPSSFELAQAAQQLASGASLAGIRDYLATSGYAAFALDQLFQDVAGRAPTAPELASNQAGLAAGGTLQGLRSYFSTTPEAAAKLAAVFTDVTGRAITPSELSGGEAAIGAGTATLAGLRSALGQSQEAADKLATLFTDVTGRAITASETADNRELLASGTATLQSLRTVLADSAETVGKLQQLYTTELHRAITAPEITSDVRMLADGSSLAAIRTILSTSDEADRAITSQYDSEFGYEPDQPTVISAADLASIRTSLAAGTDLSLAVAKAPASVSMIGFQFQGILGTSPTPDELRNSEQAIAAALRTAPISDYSPFVDPTTPITLAAQNSAQAASDITAAFQAATGAAPTAVQLAADRSELSVDFNVGAVRAQIADINAAAPPAAPAESPSILAPQTVSGSPSFIYGLFNNDILVASKSSILVGTGIEPDAAYSAHPGLVTTQVGGNTPLSTNFDPSTDFFLIAKAQASSFGDLTLTPEKGYGGGGSYTDVSAGSHLLFSVFVPDGSLTAANFKFT